LLSIVNNLGHHGGGLLGLHSTCVPEPLGDYNGKSGLILGLNGVKRVGSIHLYCFL
jgi:hypothetical protein